MTENSLPPKYFLKFFRWYCHPKLSSHIEGDLVEEYNKALRKKGRFRADVKFVVDVMLLCRPGIIRPAAGVSRVNRLGMVVSYFTIGWRTLLRGRGYTVINISGLAIGMAAAVAIGLWLFDELNYDKNFRNYPRIAKVYHHLTFDDQVYTHEGVPYPMGAELQSKFGEIESTTMATDQAEHLLNFEETNVSKMGLFVGPDFADMFSLQMLHGTTTGLNETRSIILAKTLADDLIGENPLGKMIRLDSKEDLIISGVFEDFPSNCAFADVKILLPMELYFINNESAARQRERWESYDFQCFVLLNEKASFQTVGIKMAKLGYDKGGQAMKAIKPEGFLFPMEKWHLYPEFKDGKSTGTKVQYIWMFGIIGIFILALACINFMNLSTAKSEKRSKEVGIRKVLGSARDQLIHQFLTESAIVAIIAFITGVVLVALTLPFFNDLAGKKIVIPWNDGIFALSSAGFVVVAILLAGSYPALYLSSFNPIKVLKGTFKTNRAALIPRKVLVIFQFVISAALVIGTVVVFQQIQYGKNRPAGFDRDGIIYLGVRTPGLAKANYNTLRAELLATGVVENMAKSDFPITGGASADPTLTWEGKDPAFRPLVAFNSCSHDFPKTSGFQFVEGRDFSRELAGDSSAVIVNEMAARLLSDKSPVGKKIIIGNGKEKLVIGVVKDQMRNTPFAAQWPHIYHIKYIDAGYITIRINASADLPDALSRIEAVVKKFDSGAPFDYKFLDDDYAKLFKDEERIGKLASVFTGLAIFISCLGIFGLASFAASQRVKEIGIRKVLGASVFTIWKLLSREYLQLVIASALVAGPIAYHFANRWLEKYEYRIVISWWIFAATALSLLVITLATISYQGVKAALANPVNSLRNE